MKCIDEGDFRIAWGGISSLSVALPVMWTEAQRRGFTLADIARWMSEGPARLAGYGARQGRIAADYHADLIVFDPGADLLGTKMKLSYRHPVSPYLGHRLSGEN